MFKFHRTSGRPVAILLALLVALPTIANSQFTVYDGSTRRKGEFTFSGGVETHQLESKLMARSIPYNIFLPLGYNSKDLPQKRYPVVLLLHGLTGNYKNWYEKSEFAWKSSSLEMIIVMPEGEDGWYTDGATNANDKYESYIIKELIPEIDKRFRTISDRENRAIAGLSMGGYGAVKFGLKYPDMFALAGSFSGALGVTSFPAVGRNESFLGSVNRIFGPADSETRKVNDIFRMIRDVSPEQVKTLPFLYLDCGTEDFLFASNREFADLLIEKMVPHEFRQLPGGHTWPYWDKQVQEFLRIAITSLGQSPPE
jgi:S-formylglutathione hydrolase FrmB